MGLLEGWVGFLKDYTWELYQPSSVSQCLCPKPKNFTWVKTVIFTADYGKGSKINELSLYLLYIRYI